MTSINNGARSGVLAHGTLVKAWIWRYVEDSLLVDIPPLQGMASNADMPVILTMMDAVRGGAR